ncbi:MAG: copper transporter [Solirubrobacterales bacterium]|nr:copper transporter [Solirubrobacterales bacterium]
MGYSARYHAASLAAIFLALAIGILIGSQVGGDVLNNTRKDLESSLTGDLDDARGQIDELETEAGWADEFGNSVLPPLTQNQIRGDRIGLVGFGSLPSEITESVDRAIEPTGADLVAVGVIGEPPDTEAIAGALPGGFRFPGLKRNSDALGRYGRATGRQLIVGGPLLEATKSELMSQSSGDFGDLDGLLIYRTEPGDLEPSEADQVKSLDAGLIAGAESTRAAVVGIEETGTDPSSVSYFESNDLTSVDNLDQPAGKVSLIYALAGAQGSFGVKEGSDRLLPELLQPLPPKNAGRRKQG